MTVASESARKQDVVVVGGGQAALALGFYLRRSGLDYVILDEQSHAGGAWQHGWKSLRAFSPAQWSSLPGWLMPPAKDGDYPSRDEVISYLTLYESRYALNVIRGVRVSEVTRSGDEARPLDVVFDNGEIAARAVISATGRAPFIPELAGREDFTGSQLHSVDYSGPADLAGKRVVVVGGGNSGAQIFAELTEPGSPVSHATWATIAPPVFLPDDVDGRYLFEQATARYRAQQEGRIPDPPRSLGDIVMVPPVKAARDRGDLIAVPMFERLTADGVEWPDGHRSREEVIVWATGFRPALSHLESLGVKGTDGRICVEGAAGTRSCAEPRVWLVGYGDWTGFASATLIGVGRSARATIQEVQSVLNAEVSGFPPHNHQASPDSF